jgi:hypothetical protein
MLSNEPNINYIIDTPVALSQATGFLPNDVGKIARIISTGELKILLNHFPITWADLSGGGSGSSGAKQEILSGASAGTNSGWLPVAAYAERLAYSLDSGTTSTTFSVDFSADGVTSLGQAFTGSYASSSIAEVTPPILFSDIRAKFFRITVNTGGPISFLRGV